MHNVLKYIKNLFKSRLSILLYKYNGIAVSYNALDSLPTELTVNEAYRALNIINTALINTSQYDGKCFVYLPLRITPLITSEFYFKYDSNNQLYILSIKDTAFNLPIYI